MLLPAIQAHSFKSGLNSQRSSRSPPVPPAPQPSPPNSQSLPLLSVQLDADVREPGELPEAGMPIVPYTPGEAEELPTTGIMLFPAIHAHSQVEGLNFQRSF